MGAAAVVKAADAEPCAEKPSLTPIDDDISADVINPEVQLEVIRLSTSVRTCRLTFAHADRVVVTPNSHIVRGGRFLTAMRLVEAMSPVSAAHLN